MLYDSTEIEAIKIAVSNLEGLGMSSRKVLIQSVCWLREKYEVTGEENYLTKAVWHIYAYLGMGFPYEEGEKEFNLIIKYVGKTKEELFPARQWIYKKMKLNKTNIRNLLGNWNPVLHSMKINDVVNDILEKAINEEEGTYIYHSGKLIEQNENKELWENTYKLYIDKGEIIFHNVNRNKYFILARNEK